MVFVDLLYNNQCLKLERHCAEYHHSCHLVVHAACSLAPQVNNVLFKQMFLFCPLILLWCAEKHHFKVIGNEHFTLVSWASELR